MSKSKGLRVAHRVLARCKWFVAVDYSDGTSEVTAHRSYSEARGRFDVGVLVARREPEGLLRVRLLDAVGLCLSASDAALPDSHRRRYADLAAAVTRGRSPSLASC